MDVESIVNICFNVLAIAYIINKEQGKRRHKSKGMYILLLLLLYILLPAHLPLYGLEGISIRIIVNTIFLGVLHKIIYENDWITAMLKGMLIYQLYKAAQAISMGITYGCGILLKQQNSVDTLYIYLYISQLIVIYILGCIITHIDFDKLLAYRKVRIIAGIGGVTTPTIVAAELYFLEAGNAILMGVSLVFLLNSSIFLLLWLNDKQATLSRQRKLEDENIRLAGEVHKTKEIIPAVARELSALTEETKNAETPRIDQLVKEMESLQESHVKENFKKNDTSFIHTGFQLLDRQLENHMAEASEKGIEFLVVFTKSSVEFCKDTGMHQGEMQQLIGDLARNAIRAIERAGKKDGNILLCFGYVEEENKYMIEVYDNGAPFPEKILKNMGMRGLTTGGTGHGLADIHQILLQYGGNMEVTTLQEDIYKKVITIKFPLSL